MKKDQVQEITKELEQGIKQIFESENYTNYLKFLSTFRSYSLNNTIMIFLQRPDASLVKGFQEWKKLDRYVKKGEKAIKILAPLIKKVEDEKTKQEKKVIYGFRRVSVFDVQQTEGKPLPALPVERITTEHENSRLLFETLVNAIDCPVSLTDTGEANGYYKLDTHEIAIQENLAADHQLKTLVHEYAHSLLHRKGGEFEKVTAPIREAQAESIAFVVLNYFGIDTSQYSFGYIAGWSQDPKILLKIAQEVKGTSEQIIDLISSKLSQKQEQQGQTA